MIYPLEEAITPLLLVIKDLNGSIYKPKDKNNNLMMIYQICQ